MIYLDNAATTLIKPKTVYQAAFRAISGMSSPGRGGHYYAEKADETALECRIRAAELFSVSSPEQIVFTFNATHALNMAIRSAVKENSRVLISGYEHNAVTRPLHAIGCKVSVVRSKPFDTERARELFDDMSKNADCIIVNHVSNVFGCAAPIYDIAQTAKRRGIPLIIDASQSAGAFDIDAAKLDAAFIGMPGHKGLYGTQGTGILICRDGVEPLLYGGTGSDSLNRSMPDILPDAGEAGTHNMPGIAALSEGIKFVLKTGTQNILVHERQLAYAAAQKLSMIPGVTVHSSSKDRISGVLSFGIGGMSPETAGRLLADMGIAVRAGLHCSPLAHETAGTLPEGTVRASFSYFSTTSDVSALVSGVKILASDKKINKIITQY